MRSPPAGGCAARHGHDDRTTATAPTFSRVPEGDELTRQDCVDLAAAYGIPLDAWQADIVRGVLRESGGTWSCSQAGVVVARLTFTAHSAFGSSSDIDVRWHRREDRSDEEQLWTGIKTAKPR